MQLPYYGSINNDINTLKIPYNSLVRSILEYCSIVWSPYYDNQKARIERVQTKFAKYILFKHHFPYQDLTHNTRLLLCGLKSLEQRRRDTALLFLHKLIRGDVDCTELLKRVLFSVPVRRTRHPRLFFERRHRNNYELNVFIDRLLHNYNRFFSDVDIFNMSPLALKRYLQSSLV